MSLLFFQPGFKHSHYGVESKEVLEVVVAIEDGLIPGCHPVLSPGDESTGSSGCDL